MKLKQYLIEKTIEQQKAERKAEREKEFSKLPLPVRRGMDDRIYWEQAGKQGKYVDSGYGSKQQEKDGTALNNFERKASKKDLQLLKKYEQYKKSWG
jgi:hypothetical protein